jgi:hypothetical protein
VPHTLQVAAAAMGELSEVRVRRAFCQHP